MKSMPPTVAPPSRSYRRTWGEPMRGAADRADEQRQAMLDATRKRAAEHVVAGVLSGAPASPAGLFPSAGVVPADLLSTIEAAIEERQARVLGLFPLLHFGPTLDGWPQLPLLTLPTVGAQGGEKLEAHSDAFDVVADPDAFVVDSVAYLNVSAQLERSLPGVVARLLHLAVMAEAEVQVVAAIEAAGSADGATDLAGALGHFDGQALWAPGLVLTSPGQLTKLSADVLTLQAAGIGVVVSSAATKVSVVDPTAVSGAVAINDMSAPEASVLGGQVASGIYGKVSANPAGVASATIA